MTRRIVTVPRRVFPQVVFDWDIDWRERGSSDFNSGNTRILYDGFPRWVGSPAVSLDTSNVGAMRAIRMSARGRTGLYLLKMSDPAVFSRISVSSDRNVLCLGKQFSQGNYFASGAGWEFDPFAVCAAPVSKGSKTLTVNVSSCGSVAPVVGQIMSANRWPFCVTEVRLMSGTVYEVSVEMALREDISAGDHIKMQGEGVFELVQGGSSSYSVSGFSRPDFQFVEALTR